MVGEHIMGDGYLRTARSVLRDSNYYSSTSPDIHDYPLRFVYAFHDRVGSVTSVISRGGCWDCIGTLLDLTGLRSVPQPSTLLQRNLNPNALLKDQMPRRCEGTALTGDGWYKLRAKMVTPLHIPPN